MCEIEWFATGNSRTPVAYAPDWRVLDLGSGHNPHPRADVIVDRYVEDSDHVAGRSGRGVVRPKDVHFVVADGAALPFADGSFDFVICSHVVEHVNEIDAFCQELNRIGDGGYIETPGKVAEHLRHPRYHAWFVSARNGALLFERAPQDHPLGVLGKLFYSLYFYRGRQLDGADVYPFARGVPRPFHFGFVLLSRMLHRLWEATPALTHTRLLWEGSFQWRVRR